MLTLLTCWAKGKDLRNHAMVERDLQYSATELALIKGKVMAATQAIFCALV